jgi:hypothetical protein
MIFEFTVDGTTQSFEIPSGIEIRLTGVITGNEMYLHVQSDELSEDYELDTITGGGPLMRPRRPR